MSEFLDRAILFVLRAIGSLQALILINFFMFGWMAVQPFLKHPFDPYPYTMLQTVMTIIMANIDVFILVASLAQQRLSRSQEQQNMYILEELMKTTGAIQEMLAQEEKRDTELRALVESLKEANNG
ncbi:DUF1003 domain-containing protein [Candidatus Igneacidithiobacillus taiwanensis]|uniref:DUF1003 domain-containing protein n=1 Tax=Candidatus Igneacidithiobacillus taiwanensis TaxID=1945924 RepID=UPI00289B3B3B|nr:DUF1003 domain-containing protein [Candidatus Igneacidithiobacillus taiwanensis]